jgi:hypothetical protein
MSPACHGHPGGTSDAAPTSVLPDRIGDRYRILRTLRTSPVYSEVVAHDERRDTDVKLWVVEPSLTEDPGVKGRFLAAVQSWLDAPVPGALPLHAGGVVGGTIYLRVPPWPLECLRTRLVRWKPSVDEVTHVTASLLATMKAAHQRCWLHGVLTARDVLFAGDGSVVVAGVGLWQHLARRPLLASLQHEAHGIAPEVRAGEPASPAADLYSVAAIAVELVQVATGATTTALRRRGWHPPLLEAMDRLLSSAPLQRPSSFMGLAAALDAPAAEPMVAPPAAGSVMARRPLRPPPPPPRRDSVVATPTERTHPEGSVALPPARTPRASTGPFPQLPAPGAFALPPRPLRPPSVPAWPDEPSDEDIPTMERRAGAHPRVFRRR